MNISHHPMRRLGIVFFCWLALLGCSLTVQAGTEFLSLEQVEVGMRGVVRTVVQGTQIETFDIEVLGVLPDAAASGDLVLIRASGDVIDRTGGIASGMSGSPVYIDGQLLGAIGYGFAMADHTLGLVTPIADMYRVLERIPLQERSGRTEDEPQVVSVRDLKIGNVPVEGIAIAPDPATASEWADRLGDEVLVAAPVQMPLMVAGLSERTVQRLGELLGEYNVVPMQAGGAPRGVADAEFVPGAAIGVQLARGDVNISGIGTVTYTDDGGGFLAFGHPYFNMGSVDFIATTAYIHHTVDSLQFPFKLGAPLDPVGRLLQDRGAAIAGTTASFADTLPIQINVLDRDARQRETFRVDLVRNEKLTTAVAGVVSLEAIDRAMDRLGSGTARVIMQITGEGLPKRIVRDNMYYSHSDIAATSINEFLIGLEAVVSNEFEAVRITNIRLDVEVEEERWTARIVRAVPQQWQVRPGDTVDVEVTIRPYRGQDETKIIRLDVPYDVHPGEVTVAARSGGFGYFRVPSDYVPTGVDEPSDLEDEEVESSIPTSIESLEGLLDVFMNREKNNEIVVEFFPYYYSAEGGFASGFSGGERADEDTPYYSPAGFLHPVQAGLTTRYVIQGSDTFTLRILAPERDTEAGAANESVVPEQLVSDDQGNHTEDEETIQDSDHKVPADPLVQ